jgi:hypothetical protein
MYIHICTYIHTYIHIYGHINKSRHIFVCIKMWLYVCIHIHIYIYKYVNIYLLQVIQLEEFLLLIDLITVLEWLI